MDEPKTPKQEKEEIPFAVGWLGAELIFGLVVIVLSVLVAMISN